MLPFDRDAERAGLRRSVDVVTITIATSIEVALICIEKVHTPERDTDTSDSGRLWRDGPSHANPYINKRWCRHEPIATCTHVRLVINKHSSLPARQMLRSWKQNLPRKSRRFLSSLGTTKRRWCFFRRGTQLRRRVLAADVEKLIAVVEIRHKIEQDAREKEIYRIRNVQLANALSELQEKTDALKQHTKNSNSSKFSP